jgi:DNA-binding NarL/FixJ family response regulator
MSSSMGTLRRYSASDGLSNTDIAERLNISEKTVRNHASNLFDKLGV